MTMEVFFKGPCSAQVFDFAETTGHYATVLRARLEDPFQWQPHLLVAVAPTDSRSRIPSSAPPAGALSAVRNIAFKLVSKDPPRVPRRANRCRSRSKRPLLHRE